MKKITFLVLLICVMSLGCLFLVNNNLSKTNASLNNQLQQQEQTYSGKIDELTVYQEKLVERISLLEENYSKLQTAYDELKAAYDQFIVDSTLEREQLKTTVSSLNSTIVELEQNADVDAETITALRTEVSTLETSLENQTTTANELQATVTQQEATIAELNTTIDTLIEELNSDLSSGIYKDIFNGNVTEIVAEDLDGVTEIRPYAFFNLVSLTSVELPITCTVIGDNSFASCTNLTYIDLSNVETIGSSAFNKCSSLTNVTIPDTLTSLGASAFSYCSSLTNVTIPDSLTSLGASAFSYCSNLFSIYLPDWSVIDFSSIKTISGSIVYFSGSVIIYTGLLAEPQSGFWNSINTSKRAHVKCGYTYEQYLEEIEEFFALT